MKRALKLAGRILAWALGVLLALLLIVLAEPRWFLNTKTVTAGIRKFGADYRPKWTSLSFEIRNVNLLTKRVVFDASDFCLNEKRGEVKGCFTKLTLDATVHLGFSPPVSVRRLETLVARSTDLAVDETAAPSSKKAAKKKKSGPTLQLVPRPLRRMTVGRLDVRIPKAVVVSSSGTTTAALAAAFAEEGSAPLTASAQVVVSTGPKAAQHYHAELRLDSDLLRLGHASYLDLWARLRGDGGLAADLAAKLAQAKKDELSLKVRASADVSGRRLRAKVDGTQTPERAAGSGDVAVIDPSGAVPRIELRACRFDGPLTKKGSFEKQDLTCEIAVEPKPLGGAPKGGPKQLTGKLAYHADFKAKGRAKDRFTASLKADLGPEPRLYGFFARFEAELAGRTGSLPQSLTSKHKLEIGFMVQRFQDLVAFLRKTEFAVPAPLNVFQGPVKFAARTAGDSRGPSQRVDYEASTDLSSDKQKLVTRVKGRLEVRDMFLSDRSIQDATDVTLADVMLQLPYLKLGPAPTPAVDKRIMTGNPKHDEKVERQRAQAEPPPSPVDYDAHVVTEKPVRLLSNLLKNPVPISLDLHAKTEGLSGTIRIEPFDVEIFHQTGHVDHITLTPSPGSSEMGLNGKLIYKRQDVTVDILLLGSTDKPTVTFESDPPMSQNEIVAMLLYGKSPNQLDSDQQSSAGNASEAFTSGAFGLASLYLFASTPIDSVGYDPATQTYQIKFKLPGGATLGVGSNLEESKTISLRKRVARNLELETQLRSSQGQQGPQGRDAITTFLEWFRRY